MVEANFDTHVLFVCVVSFRVAGVDKTRMCRKRKKRAWQNEDDEQESDGAEEITDKDEEEEDWDGRFRAWMLWQWDWTL